MIRRFMYHGFWNFYDHLGLLILVGAAYAIIAVGAAVVGVSFLTGNSAWWPSVLAVGIFQFVLLTVVLSGLLLFSAKAARGESARFADIITGVKKQWLIVSKILAIVTGFAAVLIVNLNFYMSMQTAVASTGIRMAMIIITAVIAWTGLAFYFFSAPLLCAATSTTEKKTLWTAFNKGLMAMALVPHLWILLGIFGTGLLAAGLYTRIGLIFVVPVMASLCQTAFQLAVQFAAFLTEAKQDLGEGQTLRAYKKHAKNKCWEWEHRQPRRTAKELIRPWDY